MLEFRVQTTIPTQFGAFDLLLFKDPKDQKEHLLLAFPDLKSVEKSIQSGLCPLVRIHSECMTGEALGSLRCDCREQLNSAMQKISVSGLGLIAYLKQEGRGIGLEAKLKAYNLQDQGLDTAEANERLGFAVDDREYDAALNMFAYLGLKKASLLTNNPQKRAALENAGIHIEQTIPLVSTQNKHNQDYLKTKAEKMGHITLKK